MGIPQALRSQIHAYEFQKEGVMARRSVGYRQALSVDRQEGASKLGQRLGGWQREVGASSVSSTMKELRHKA